MLLLATFSGYRTIEDKTPETFVEWEEYERNNAVWASSCPDIQDR
jgi:hypothetical protein